MKDSVWTMVHDPAIPFVVDAARLGTGIIMYFQRQPGNHHASEGEQNDYVAHNISRLVIVTWQDLATALWPTL